MTGCEGYSLDAPLCEWCAGPTMIFIAQKGSPEKIQMVIEPISDVGVEWDACEAKVLRAAGSENFSQK